MAKPRIAEHKRVMAKRAKTERVPVPSGEPVRPGDAITLTDDYVLLFAKLLTVGYPPEMAVKAMFPPMEPLQLTSTVAAWMADTRIHHEVASINGGQWHTLDKMKRFELAYEKMQAEAAFWMWSTNWATLSAKEDLDKAKQAREMLANVLGKKIDDDDPMQAFARMAVTLTQNAEAERAAAKKKAPQLQVDRVQ